MQPLLQQFKIYLTQRSGLNSKPDFDGPALKGQSSKRATQMINQRPVLRTGPVGSSISPSTIKNYLSDINLFFNFIAGSIQESIVQPIHITPAIIKSYITAAAAQLSPPSLNRHLSSLRFFGKFLVDARLCETNPAQNLTNPAFDPTLAQIITRYQKFLTTESLSKSTIKNYLSDLKKYLLWARKNIKTTDEALTARSLT